MFAVEYMCPVWFPTKRMLFLMTVVVLLVSPGVDMSSDGCSGFCRRTGFSGVIGNCACGLTLFSSKRSVLPAKMSGDSPSIGSGSLSASATAGPLSRNGIPKYLDSAAKLLSSTYYESAPMDNSGSVDDYTVDV